MTAEQWKNATRGLVYRPLKRQITARVDADVLDWLKAQGKGYQSRINAILRREMLATLKSASPPLALGDQKRPQPTAK